MMIQRLVSMFGVLDFIGMKVGVEASMFDNVAKFMRCILIKLIIYRGLC
jgi:hypothetical protein